MWLLDVRCVLSVIRPMSSYSTQTLTSVFTEWLIHLRMHKTSSSSRHITQTYSDLIIFRFLYTSCSEITLANTRSISPESFILAFLPTRKPWNRTHFILFYCPLCSIKVSNTQKFSFFPHVLQCTNYLFLFLIYFSSQKCSIYLVIPIQ